MPILGKDVETGKTAWGYRTVNKNALWPTCSEWKNKKINALQPDINIHVMRHCALKSLCQSIRSKHVEEVRFSGFSPYNAEIKGYVIKVS